MQVHVSLLQKLRRYRICSKPFSPICSSLNNRHLWLAQDGKNLGECPTNPQIPQGSILGPTLFMVYISNLPDDVVCIIAIYTDGTTFYSKFGGTFNSRQQCELAFELECDHKSPVNWIWRSLLISVLGKLSFFHLIVQDTLVQLVQKWMGFAYWKIILWYAVIVFFFWFILWFLHCLYFWNCFYENWRSDSFQTVLFVLTSCVTSTILFFFDLPCNLLVMSGQFLVIAIWICWISTKKVMWGSCSCTCCFCWTTGSWSKCGQSKFVF